MRRALFTFGFGPAAAWLDITRPSMQAYAQAQGAEFIQQPSGHGREDRPHSWWKIPVALDLFAWGFDELLWVDADCVVMRTDENPFDYMAADASLGLVVHKRICQPGDKLSEIPNCGVLALRRGCIPLLEHAWTRIEYVNHPWWEQASIMSMLGVWPRSPCVMPSVAAREKNPWWRYVSLLPPTFNAWPDDPRYGELDAVVRHAAGIKEGRADVLRKWEKERSK